MVVTLVSEFLYLGIKTLLSCIFRSLRNVRVAAVVSKLREVALLE